MSGAEDLEAIFDRFSKQTNPIFKNRDVLRHTYVPDRLPHREEQYRTLAHVLAPVMANETPSNVFLHGKPGSGKTAVTKFVLNVLKKKAEKENINMMFSYINCQLIDTSYRIFAHLAQDLGKSVPITGLPTDEVFNLFKQALEEKKTMLVVALDEIDLAVRKSPDIFYPLTRINSDLKNSKLSIIGITNDVHFKNKLDPRVKSSLTEQEIVFPPYTAPQLVDILVERAKEGFHDNVVDDAAIGLCAALAAQENGDARRALDLLRVAGELAEREGASRVTEEHVRKALEVIERNTVAEVLTTLPIQSKVILLAIYNLSKEKITEEITTGTLYEEYCNVCSQIGLEKLTQRRVGDLVNELDMLGMVTSRVVSKGRYGRTKIVSLAVHAEEIKNALEKDYRLGTLLSN